ncbi:MAG TPA: 4Fe-4S dicluster domain-containing protein, partial [Bryobacteraceae bacterium]|nr:4Fe-4S dicluster domain-containing protein [Bryobacteraceae bacterium]
PLPGEDKLRQAARDLLSSAAVQVVIGHGSRGPVFITKPEDAGRLVWNTGCTGNLTAYLKRKEVRALGKAAVVVKGCDERALVVLEKESQVERAGLHVIGMACDGMGEPKCETCDVHQPRFADQVIGSAAAASNGDGRYQELEAFMRKSPPERMDYWAREFDRCVKCYACRQSCPMCFCERCVADKNRPVTIRTSATREDNFAWHITRAFHLAGRCVGCDECTRACPAGIDLRLLNMAVAKAAEDQFGYRAGMDPAAELVIGSYATSDQEGFIR